MKALDGADTFICKKGIKKAKIITIETTKYNKINPLNTYKHRALHYYLVNKWKQHMEAEHRSPTCYCDL